MMYYDAKARASAIDDIKKCIDVLGGIKSSELSYLDYRAITKYLNMLIDEIEKEGRKRK